MDLSFIINELGEERREYYNAIAPPIIQTSNFAFNRVEDLRQAFEDEMSGYLYSRGLNPTVDILRQKLAALDGAEDSLVFNNGAAAIYAGIVANIKSGDHIVSVRHPYTWAAHLFDKILPRFGVSTTYVDGTTIEAFERAILPNTALIYLESPNSWYFDIQDIRAVADLARAEQIVTLIDNSYCTPIYQKPVEMGIDIAMQTATKYIGGHSDTLGGVLSGSAAMMRKIFESEYLCVGSGIQPFNAWMLLRGLRTLPARLEHVTKNVKEVAAFLKGHPMVEEIIYPHDPGFPQYNLARKQMKAAPGLVSFYMRAAEIGDIERFCESLKHFHIAVSWGGYESLVIPRCASIRPADFDPANRDHRMLRVYTGLEDAAYLIQDLAQAFEKATI
jgi:cystathionine beta-lyase/cystathionine gamma-synthase